MNRLRMACIMIGGFLGPFAGQSLVVVLPEFAAEFGITQAQASLTMTAYMLPFAVAMLFSSYLVRNRPPAPVIRTAYSIIALASIVLVFTPKWWLFVVAFVVAGISNAFTAPLLQQVLKHITPDRKLGQAMGTYAAMQSFGMFSAPLVAGVASLVTWRLLYVALGLFALLIVLVGLPDAPPGAAGVTPGARKVNASVIRACLTLLAVGTGVIGMSVIISLHLGERFDAGPVTRGFVVMAGGLTAFLFARYIGSVADRIGARPVLAGGLVVAAIALVGIGISPSLGVLAVLWGLAVLAAQGTQLSVNMLVLRAPGGATMLSTVQAFRFFGNALTPLLILPIYQTLPIGGFLAAASVLLSMAAVNAVAGRSATQAT